MNQSVGKPETPQIIGSQPKKGRTAAWHYWNDSSHNSQIIATCSRSRILIWSFTEFFWNVAYLCESTHNEQLYYACHGHLCAITRACIRACWRVSIYILKLSHV